MRNNINVAQDARLIVQLERLRDEAEMRKARRWWRDDFWPRTAADYLKIEMAHGSQENKWLRQVATYWGMAASFVPDGTLSEKAILRPEFSDEMFAMFAKVHPFLKELRARMRNPDFMVNVEKVIFSSKLGRERLRHSEQQVHTSQKDLPNSSDVDVAARHITNKEGNRPRAARSASA